MLFDIPFLADWNKPGRRDPDQISHLKEEIAKLKKKLAKSKRHSKKRARESQEIVPVKVFLEKTHRKWEFIWDGRKISANITNFLGLIAAIRRKPLQLQYKLIFS